MFDRSGFQVDRADPCVIHRYDATWEADCAVTVDDCFFVVSSTEAREAVMSMFTAQFGSAGFTYMKGNRIDLLSLPTHVKLNWFVLTVERAIWYGPRSCSLGLD